VNEMLGWKISRGKSGSAAFFILFLVLQMIPYRGNIFQGVFIPPSLKKRSVANPRKSFSVAGTNFIAVLHIYMKNHAIQNVHPMLRRIDFLNAFPHIHDQIHKK
jgi:hypothetical protein